MNKSTSDASFNILVFMLFAAAFLLQACESIYTSSIIIVKDIESISTDSEKKKKDEYFNMMFEEFCSHKKFEIKALLMESAQSEKALRDKQMERKSCRAQWFYNASLWNKPAEYKIELSLMQPWSLWHSGKQERFFCSETKDMFDFFKTGLTGAQVTYKPYAKCPQVKVQ